jgi:transglutaminase-like putative cysteine protease
MRVRVGCEFEYDTTSPTPSVWQVRPRPDGPHRLVSESWDGSWGLGGRSSHLDRFGNLCDRLMLAGGGSVVRYDGVVEVAEAFDEADKGAAQVPVEALPDEALVFLLPSRFCWSDVLQDRAWELFGGTPPGWPRVQAICDWTHHNICYESGSSTAVTTALDILENGRGVCRDFTHVGVTFCRSLSIPARYVSGYLPDIGVPPPDEPMDFCSWFEAYLEGGWWTFDPRNNVPRTGRVPIAWGRDALDVAMVTTFGTAVLKTMAVWADEVAEAG